MRKKKKGRHNVKRTLNYEPPRAGNPFSIVRRSIGSPWFLGIADQAALGGGNFLIGLIVAHNCSKAEFGLFSLGMTLILLMQDFLAGLVSTHQALRSAKYEGIALKVFTGSTLTHQVILSVFCVSLLGAIAAILFTMNIGLTGLSPVLGAIALFAAFTLLREYWRRFLILKGRMGYIFVIDAGITLTQITALIVIIYLGEVTAAIAHIVIGLVCACFALPLLFIFMKDYDVSMRSIWPDFKDNVRIGGWLLLNSILWSVGNYAYPWMLAMIHGSEATGIWSACMSVIAIINIALAGIMNVLTPRIARIYADGGIADFRPYIHKACINYVAFALVLTCIPVVFGDKLISIVYGSAYSGTQLIISVLALNAVFGAITFCFGRGLMVIGRTNWDFFFNVGTLILVFTFGWWSTQVYGALGAAIGLTVANGIATLMRFIAFEWFSRSGLLTAHST